LHPAFSRCKTGGKKMQAAGNHGLNTTKFSLFRAFCRSVHLGEKLVQNRILRAFARLFFVYSMRNFHLTPPPVYPNVQAAEVPVKPSLCLPFS
jgi:hypothetical protein